MTDLTLQIIVCMRRLRRGIVGAAALMIVLGFIAEMAVRFVTHGTARRALDLLRLDTEWSLASWFSTLLLLGTALLLVIVARATRAAERPHERSWMFLALGFGFLSLDEAVGLHELISGPVQRLLGTSGWLHFAWVIPAAIVVAIAGVLLLPLLRDLPRATAKLFLLAAAMYVGGAIGMELVAGAIVTSADPAPGVYAVAACTEEILEISGIVLFLWAALGYLEEDLDLREIRIRRADPPAGDA